MEERRFGFVYIWYDRKRKMFYIGSHWNQENDGYICSNNRMRDAHRRRPHDFKRRIIQRCENISYNELHDKEHVWLTMIPDEQLGKKYYNLYKERNHWRNCKHYLTVSEKISKAKKGKSWESFDIEKAAIRKQQLSVKMNGNTYAKSNKGIKKKPETVQNMKAAQQNYRKENPTTESDRIRLKTQLSRFRENNPNYQSGSNNVNYGKKWYNNGVINKMFYPSQVIEGFIKGKLKNNKEQTNSSRSEASVP